MAIRVGAAPRMDGFVVGPRPGYNGCIGRAETHFGGLLRAAHGSTPFVWVRTADEILAKGRAQVTSD